MGAVFGSAVIQGPWLASSEALAKDKGSVPSRKKGASMPKAMRGVSVQETSSRRGYVAGDIFLWEATACCLP